MLRPLAALLRPALDVVRILRFRTWTARLAISLRRRGVRLILDAPSVVRMSTPPRLELDVPGAMSGTFTLVIGSHVDLGADLVLELRGRGDSRLVLGERVALQRSIRLTLRPGAIEIGPRTLVRDRVSLKSDGALRVGADVLLAADVSLHCTQSITIGDSATLAERTSVVDSDHGADGTDDYVMDRPLRVSPVAIGRNALVSVNAVILRGAQVGPNSVIAAQSVVRNGSYPAGWVIGGIPARPLRELGGGETGGAVEQAPAEPSDNV